MQRRLDRRDIPFMAALTAVFACYVLFFIRGGYAFCSSLDWTAQHYAIPDMFRKLFYETGELFPSLALNLGGGENIYDLSYYGLYSPVILISYLMPSVPMYIYIQVSTAVLVYSACLLFYRFARRRNGRVLSFVLALMFFSAHPLMLHTHRHVMFVSYMPLLVLALECVDDYLEQGKKLRLTVVCFLMIMTSWFFSVGALCAVAVYAVYRYLSLHEEIKARDLLLTGAEMAGRLFVSVLMAGVLLLPTLGAVLGGRDAAHVEIDLKSFLPSVYIDYIGYSGYCLGLGALAVLSVTSAIIRGDKARRFLGVVFALLYTCPVFVYILNGTLYLDPKSLLPFMPLAVVLCEGLFKDAARRRLRLPEMIAALAVLALGIILCETKSVQEAFEADGILLLICMALYLFRPSSRWFYLSALIIPMAASWTISNKDYRATCARVRALNSEDYTKLCEYISDDDLWRSSRADERKDSSNLVYAEGYYSPYIYSSVHNRYYNSFYFEEMNNENEYRNSALTTFSFDPFFQVFMGNRYILTSSETVPYGCEVVAEENGKRLLENRFAASIGRCAPTLSEQVFDTLSGPEKKEALCNYIITGDSVDYSTDVVRIEDLAFPEHENITRVEDGYVIKAEESFEAQLYLPEPLQPGKLLIIELDVDNTIGKQGDARLTINGIRNTLTNATWKYYNNNTTFTYVLNTVNGRPLERLDLLFSSGEYSMSGLRTYLADYPTRACEVDSMRVDRSRTSGDVITGSIHCSKDSMFMLTLPYSKGYEVTVDGKKQELQLVSKAFIGFELTEGDHEIVVRFTAPLLGAGKAASLLGFGALAALAALELPKKKKAPSSERSEK